MNNDSTLVAVTGSSGFIGNNLVRSLLNSHQKVRALVRNPSKFPIKHPRLQVITGNLHSKNSLQKLVHNADYVIHCAGRVRGAKQAEFDSENVIGTQNLLDVCIEASTCKKFIFISSLAARQPKLSYYAQSKHSAECLLTNTSNLDWTIIRPPAVYGPYDKELLPLLNWLQKGILWIPGNSQQKFSLIHVEDLVKLIILQLSSSASGEILEPDDHNSYDWQLISEISQQFFNRRVRIITLPYTAISLVAKLNVLLSRLFDYSPMLTPSKMNELMHDNWVATGVAPSSQWTANIDFKKGLSTLYSHL